MIDFITSTLNINDDDIKNPDVRRGGEDLIVVLKLKSKSLDYPYGGGKA